MSEERAAVTRADLISRRLSDLSEWIDCSPANENRNDEALLWGRVSKVTEEAGEAVTALIAATGQNPRKAHAGQGDYTPVAKELLDVAVTALSAWAHVSCFYTSGNQDLPLDPIRALSEHLAIVHRRAGLDRAPRDPDRDRVHQSFDAQTALYPCCGLSVDELPGECSTPRADLVTCSGRTS